MLFSIIIPVYNSQNYIKKCVLSVINQTYKDWEIIIVDDGSTDKSGEICDTLAKTNNKIKVHHKKNAGVSSARNVGIELASGERVMFLDSDDELEPNTLEVLFNEISKYDYDVIGWALKTNTVPSQYFPLNKTFTYAKREDDELLDDLRCRAFGGASRNGKRDYSMHFIVTKAIKREFILQNKIRFNENLKYHEDTLFCIEVMEKAKSIAGINQYLYIRNEHEGSVSVSFYPQIDRNNQQCIDIIQEFAENYHLNDSFYSCAIDKYKLAWFMQVLKLNFLNKRNNLSWLDNIKGIKSVLNTKKYSIKGSLFRRDLKIKQRGFAFLINSKGSILLYVLSKIIWNSRGNNQ